jgi:hypothetical protein
MAWKVTLPEVSVLAAAFEHPQILRNPNPVTKDDGSASAKANFETLAAVVTIDDGDWRSVSDSFKSIMGIVTSAVAGDYVKAIGQTISTFDAAEGRWDDSKAELEVKLNKVAVKFEQVGQPASTASSYYAYFVRAPFCRWDRFVDDLDLVPETTGLVHCEQLFHGVLGQKVDAGIPREASVTERTKTSSGTYEPVLNIGVGSLEGGSVAHEVQFNVRLRVQTPGDGFLDLVLDPTMLIETDPRMATHLPKLELVVVAGSVDDIARVADVPRGRIVELLKRRGLAAEEAAGAPGAGGTTGSDAPPGPAIPQPPRFVPKSRLAVPGSLRPPFFREHVRTDFVPGNRLAAAFVSLFDAADIPRIPHVLAAMDPLRLRRLAAGLGASRGAGVEGLSAHLVERVFVGPPGC